MSRSRKKHPFDTVVVWNYGDGVFKRKHHHKLRQKRKLYLRRCAESPEDEFPSMSYPDEGTIKTEGEDIYLSGKDGGPYWIGDMKHSRDPYLAECYVKAMRK